MIELAWSVAGAAATLLALHLLQARQRRNASAAATAATAAASAHAELADALAGAPAAAEAPAHEAPAEPCRDNVCTPPDARQFAVSLADELATLVSGVEGRAHALIECAPHRAMLPAAAEGLLAAIQRLRTLHNKLLAFGRESSGESGSIDVCDLITGLSDELQQMQLGIELRWDPPRTLPRLAASPTVVREAMLFLCSALLRAERGATQLSIGAELCLADDTPIVQIELSLEWAVERSHASTERGTDMAFSIENEAAGNLLRSQGGSVTIAHLTGRAARAVIRLPAVADDGAMLPGGSAEASRASRDPAGASMPHRYGGALVLEADPSIRSMLANELKATGRAVFACADGAAACSFLAATPERFELLILDDHVRLEADDDLGRTIRSCAPDLKICVLGTESASPAEWPRLHHIHKPFGVHELRQALATVLAGG